jgi:hypothetical protein
MLAAELPGSHFVAARSIWEWRLRPERLTTEAIEFVADCWRTTARRRRTARP